jgi:hypothetical protein
MARPKKKAGSKPGPKPDPERVRSVTTILRSRPEWRKWVEDLAAFDRAPSLVELMDRALVAYARGVKFPTPPPRR